MINIFSLYIIFQIYFNYLAASLRNPGTPPMPSQGQTEDTTAILMESNSEPIKLCLKCGLTKPERAHHCSMCGRCVMKMDRMRFLI
jgi:palmitoyltransferase